MLVYSIFSAVRKNKIRTLDSGEAEAIALAIEMDADLLLIDEKEDRNAARQAGLRITGVLGILLRAKQMGRITSVLPEIQALRQTAQFFISSQLEAAILKQAGE